MAFALVAHVSANGPTTFTTGAIDTTGATLIVVFRSTFQVTIATLTDSKSNTWTPRTSQGVAGGAHATILYCASPVVGSGHTFTLTGSSFADCFVLAFSGVDTATPYDTEAAGVFGTGFAGSADAGSFTPTNDNALIVAGFASDSGATMTATAAMTIESDGQFAFGGGNNFAGVMSWLAQGAKAAINAGYTFSGTVGGGIVAAAFNAGAGGGGRTTKNTRSQDLGMEVGMNWRGEPL